MKHAERGRRDAPDPVPLAVVFEICLVAAKLFPVRDHVGALLVGILQRSRDPPRAQLRQIRFDFVLVSPASFTITFHRSSVISSLLAMQGQF